MNKIILKGRLTQNPQLKRIGDDEIPVCDFCIAVNRKFEKNKADFFNCQAWRKTAELINEYCSKGKEILVVGEVRIEKYTKDDETRTYTKVVVDEVEFCGTKNDNNEEAHSSNDDVAPISSSNFEEVANEDDLPF